MKKKIGMVSLGCAKNLVDSEMMLASFPGDRFEITPKPEEADVIIVNTCGFIESAKKEAIDTILEMASHKQAKLIVTGCFVERNLEELKKAIPEVDLWVPIRDYPKMNLLVSELLGEKGIIKLNPMRRMISTAPYFAYLRISDGCDNFCSFCAIPYIRGRMKSRPLEEIVGEALILRSKGIKEIALVSQDPMHYGCDIKGCPNMVDLMSALDKMGFYSIKVLYMYPEEVTDEELRFIKNSKTIDPYFDVPIQTASNKMLRLMNRHGTVEEMKTLFRKIKAMMPNAVLRTTLITGFPGETKKEHEETVKFLEEIPFDHLGVFTFSREEGTAAYNMLHQVRSATAIRRKDEIMTLAKKISYRLNKERIGDEMEGIVTGYDKKRDMYTLRSYWNAPDDIDGNIYFYSTKTHKEGDIAKVRISSAMVYDLIGEETN